MSFSWKSIIRFIIVSPLKVISILIALSLLLSYLSIYISPAKFWPIAYFGLFFQVFFILNIFLLLLWGISRRKIAWIHAIILLPSILFLSSFIQLCNKQKTCTNKQLKVISYNVQMFQLPFKKADSSYLKIAAFLNSEKADIVCLQEFFTSKQNMQESDFRKLLTSTKHKYVYYSINKKNTNYGVATYSRYPIIAQGEIFTASIGGNTATYCDIDIDGKIIRVYNNHLQSIKLNLPKSIRRITGNQEERIGEILNVSQKLKTAFIKRSEQVDLVSKHIQQSPYPVIVCGDFNDTPMSYTYHTLKSGLKDAFCEAGRGMPSTHEGFFPSFRIDYILHSKEFQTSTYTVSDVNYSDHFPVIAQLKREN